MPDQKYATVIICSGVQKWLPSPIPNNVFIYLNICYTLQATFRILILFCVLPSNKRLFTPYLHVISTKNKTIKKNALCIYIYSI